MKSSNYLSKATCALCAALFLLFPASAEEIVDAAREGNSDPVQAGVKAHTKAKQVEQEVKPLSKEERERIRINEWFNSDWSEEIAAQEAQAQAERDAEERDRRGGFWSG